MRFSLRSIAHRVILPDRYHQVPQGRQNLDSTFVPRLLQMIVSLRTTASNPKLSLGQLFMSLAYAHSLHTGQKTII